MTADDSMRNPTASMTTMDMTTSIGMPINMTITKTIEHDDDDPEEPEGAGFRCVAG